MSRQYDAIIIGAGIIGGAIGLELARKGAKTLNVDRLPAAGYGSTSNTCAIIRFHYSTAEGVAMARESYYYWLDWPKHIGAPDENGMAHYVNTGCLVIKEEENDYCEPVMAHLDNLKVAYEELGPEELGEFLPYVDTRHFGPPVLAEDPRFGQPTGEAVAGAIYIPESGYINDPQLACHNQQRGCEARGGQYLFKSSPRTAEPPASSWPTAPRSWRRSWSMRRGRTPSRSTAWRGSRRVCGSGPGRSSGRSVTCPHQRASISTRKG
jgi:sarcosine oxidase subunit beta